MLSVDTAIVWMVLSPLAFLTNFFSIVFVLHYNPLFHSIDVALISLLVTMAFNSWLLLPIAAVMRLGNFEWTEDMCTFYVWLNITLRSAHLLVLLVFNVYWMASLRMSKRDKLFTSSKGVKASVFASWFTAIIAGLVPVTGGTKIFNFFSSWPSECKFLPYNVDVGFVVWFVVLSLVSVILGITSSADTLMLLRSVKAVSASRRRIHPPRPSTVAESSAADLHAQFNELDGCTELCMLVLCFTIASSLLNGLPLMVRGGYMYFSFFCSFVHRYFLLIRARDIHAI